MNRILICEYHSPCGILLLGEYNGKLCLCDWLSSPRHESVCRRVARGLQAEIISSQTPFLEHVAAELDEYFSGARTSFDLPLLLVGTDFQKQVWQSLLSIPYGETITYGEQARRLGTPCAVRAVASANGSNALSIVIPCHRVIGNNNALTGYAGGLNIKQYLLELENIEKMAKFSNKC